MTAWPPPVYRLRQEFDAPRSFVFRWCTDYRPDDAARAGEEYERRILARSAREVVYEDLWSEKDGWRWRRYRVTLSPPDRWHAESVGNVREATIDYRLTELAGARTALDLELRRRPVSERFPQPPRRAMEAELRALWGNYAAALEKEFRRTRRRRSA